MKFQNTFSTAALLGVASSHTIFTNFINGGTVNGMLQKSYTKFLKKLTIAGVGVGIRCPSYDGVRNYKPRPFLVADL